MTDKKSEAKTVPDFKVKENLLSFELPDVTEQASDFIGEDVIEPEIEETATFDNSGEESRGAIDDKGNPFDPKIHASPPEKTGKFGKWKRLPKSQQKAQAETQSNAAFRKSSQNFANLYANAHVTLFGQNGFTDKEALLPMVDALETYFTEEGLKEMSPKLAVILSAVNYSTVVCTREKNAEKLKRWFTPAWKTIKGLFGFKTKVTQKEIPKEKQRADLKTVVTEKGQF